MEKQKISNKPRILIVSWIMLALGFWHPAGAQSLTQGLITGNNLIEQTGKGSLHGTLGEPMVETYEGGQVVLTQGFYQNFFDQTGASVPTGSEFFVFPNPNDGHFYIDLALAKEGDVIIELFTAAGQLALRTGMGILSASVHRLSLDANRLAGGVYFITILIDSERKLLTEAFRSGPLQGKPLKYNLYQKIIIVH